MKPVIVLAGAVLVAHAVQFAATLHLPALRPQATIVETNDATPREVLGRKLFFDPILSATGKRSCVSCHEPIMGWASRGRPIGLDGFPLPRKAPTLMNRSSGRAFFWDGRASSLEEQALKPILERKEMGNVTLTPVLDRLRTSKYGPLFDRAFEDGVTANNLATALADFERTIKRKSPWDDYAAGKVDFTDSQERGYALFTGRAGCYKCHPPKGNFTDERFHNTGMGGKDYGRWNVTRREEDIGKFKTPTLRGCSLTAPYMHDASVPTLVGVVEHYNAGGRVHETGKTDVLVFPLRLTPDEKADLIEFLKTL